MSHILTSSNSPTSITRLMDETEAAKLLNLSVGYLRRRRLLGLSPKWMKLGLRSVRYSQEDLSDFMAENTRGGERIA